RAAAVSYVGGSAQTRISAPLRSASFRGEGAGSVLDGRPRVLYVVDADRRRGHLFAERAGDLRRRGAGEAAHRVPLLAEQEPEERPGRRALGRWVLPAGDLDLDRGRQRLAEARRGRALGRNHVAEAEPTHELGRHVAPLVQHEPALERDVIEAELLV